MEDRRAAVVYGPAFNAVTVRRRARADASTHVDGMSRTAYDDAVNFMEDGDTADE